MKEAKCLGLWAESHLLSLRAEHISATDNVKAHWLSRIRVEQAEWTLHPSQFQDLTRLFGVPKVDLFATRGNRQIHQFFARYATPEVEGVDTLCCPWPAGLLYAFPPFPHIQRVIWRLLEERAELLLLAPYWPRCLWFADLMSLSVAPPWQIPPPGHLSFRDL